MRRMELFEGAGARAGLWLEVERTGLPGIRAEVAASDRMVVTQTGRSVLLFGWRRPRYEGVDWARTDLAAGYASPVGPLSAERARKIGESGGQQALGQWAHLFAGRIHHARGPLHTGIWTLTAGSWPAQGVPDSIAQCERWHSAVLTDRTCGFIDWTPTAAAQQILPLRSLSDPDAARVKALRKLAREGCLPPVLLWWISGLHCRVVLDGHDRIVAARAEGIAPQILELASASRVDKTERSSTWAIDDYGMRMAHAEQRAADRDPFAPLAIASAGRGLAKDLYEIGTMPARTRAWQMRGGRATWTRQADEHAPGWLTRVSEQHG